MRIKIGRRTAKAAAIAALTAGIAVANAGSAYAAAPSGVETCPSGAVCLYYNSDTYGYGSWEDWSPGQMVDLHNYRFAHWANGSGYGQIVADNAAFYVNNTNDTIIISADSESAPGEACTILWDPHTYGGLSCGTNHDIAMTT